LKAVRGNYGSGDAARDSEIVSHRNVRDKRLHGPCRSVSRPNVLQLGHVGLVNRRRITMMKTISICVYISWKLSRSDTCRPSPTRLTRLRFSLSSAAGTEGCFAFRMARLHQAQVSIQSPVVIRYVMHYDRFYTDGQLHCPRSVTEAIAKMYGASTIQAVCAPQEPFVSGLRKAARARSSSGESANRCSAVTNAYHAEPPQAVRQASPKAHQAPSSCRTVR
jgi:hypothetical protein